jgi:type IV secretory pathway VirB2 component (pilin)
MKLNSKIVISLVACIFFVIVDSTYASGATTYSIGGQICKIRFLFCGAVRATLCALAIIMVGLMTIAGRMQWGTAVIILLGMTLFANAEFFAVMFTSNPRCFCAPITLPVPPQVANP